MTPLTNLWKSSKLLLILCVCLVEISPLYCQEDSTVVIEEIPEVIVGQTEEQEDSSEILIGYETDEDSIEEIEIAPAIPVWWWLIPLLLLLAGVLLEVPNWFGKKAVPTEGVFPRLAAYLILLALIVFAGLFVYNFVLAQQQDIMAQNRTRVRKGACEVGSSFGIRILGPRGNDLRGKGKKKILFNLIRPGLRVDSNAKLILQSENTVVKDYPGTVTATIYRGAAGQTQFHQIQGHANNSEELKAVLKATVPGMSAPGGISITNRQAIEVVRVVVHWKPDAQTDECTAQDKLTIVWRYNASPRASSFEPLHPAKKSKPPKWRSTVRYSPVIMEETTGFAGDTNFATQTSVIFAVKDGFSCCGLPNKQYAIVQFVKHRWKIGNGPTRRDTWNLDGPSSQATDHAAGRPYNPTYSESNSGLQTLGPWSEKGGDAISVSDFPGLLGPDHRRFLQRGGLMEWEFWTLLVCQETPPTAGQYLSTAVVQAYTHFKITRVYAGGGEEPGVKPKIFKNDRKYFATCTLLEPVLRDKGLTGAFNNPRPHELPLGQ